jgi:hypothetical protein
MKVFHFVRRPPSVQHFGLAVSSTMMIQAHHHLLDLQHPRVQSSIQQIRKLSWYAYEACPEMSYMIHFLHAVMHIAAVIQIAFNLVTNNNLNSPFMDFLMRPSSRPSNLVMFSLIFMSCGFLAQREYSGTRQCTASALSFCENHLTQLILAFLTRYYNMIEWAEKFSTWKTAVQAQSNLVKIESSASTAGDVSWSMVDRPDDCWCNDSSSSSSGRKTTLQLPKNPAATTTPTIEDHSSLEQRVATRHSICNYLRLCISTFSVVLGTVACLRMMHERLVQAFIYVDRDTQFRRFARAYQMVTCQLEGRKMMESWQWWKTVIEFIYLRILASTIVGEC